MSWLDTLLGLGLTGTGAALDQEPGSTLEARQALRNMFNQPATNPLAPGGAYDLALPFFQRQEQDVLDALQTRYSRAFPSTAGIQGPEVEALRRTTADIATNRNALASGLLESQQERALRAATGLLSVDRPDPFAGALANLGTMLTFGGLGGFGGGGGGSGISGLLQSLLGGGQGVGQGGGQGGGGQVGNILQSLLGGGGGTDLGTTLAQQIMSSGGPSSPLIAQISNLLGGAKIGFDAAMAGGGLSGLTVTNSYGVPIALESVSSLSGPAAAGAGGGLSSLASFFGPLAAAAGGGFTGYQLGPRIGSNQFQSSGVGALSGAAMGALIGSIIPGVGTLIGALLGGGSGLLGGFVGERQQQHEQKAEFRRDDLDSQRDQVYELGNIGGQFMSQLGATPQQTQAFSAYVEQLAQTSESPADEQGMVAARLGQILQPLAQARGYASLDQVPGLRQSFIDYMVANTFTSGNSAFGGGPALDRIAQGLTTTGANAGQPGWAELVGLQHGGSLPFGGPAIVGERGPEMMLAGPGTTVIPMGSDGFSMQQGLQSMVPGAQMTSQMPKTPSLNLSGMSDRRRLMQAVPKLLEMLDAA